MIAVTKTLSRQQSHAPQLLTRFREHQVTNYCQCSKCCEIFNSTKKGKKHVKENTCKVDGKGT